jgi:hypothetical protein
MQQQAICLKQAKTNNINSASNACLSLYIIQGSIEKKDTGAFSSFIDNISDL